MTYLVTEPTPATTTYIRSGRGGAGNIRSSKKHQQQHHNISTMAVPSHSQPLNRRFFSGIGGAGNAHSASERPTLSLDDEFRRAAEREKAPVGHCGIGGAGNVFRRKPSTSSSSTISSRDGDKEEDDMSETSSTSSRTKLWARISGSFTRD